MKFNRGILGIDSSSNEQSEIYGEKARDFNVRDEYLSIKHLERRTTLAQKSSSLHTNGNILAPETLPPRVKSEKLYQSKGGAARTLSFDETHNRIFFRRMDRPQNTQRAQNIRDQELSGKDYNIVNHTIINHWPSRTLNRDVNKVLNHPSQASLEGPRNLQGSLKFV